MLLGLGLFSWFDHQGYFLFRSIQTQYAGKALPIESILDTCEYILVDEERSFTFKVRLLGLKKHAEHPGKLLVSGQIVQLKFDPWLHTDVDGVPLVYLYLYEKDQWQDVGLKLIQAGLAEPNHDHLHGRADVYLKSFIQERQE